jgi:hypothetical protein
MLSEAQQRIASYAVAAATEDAGITVSAEDLPDAEQLRELGWLDRKMDGDEVVYTLTTRGRIALHLNEMMSPDSATLN